MLAHFTQKSAIPSVVALGLHPAIDVCTLLRPIVESQTIPPLQWSDTMDRFQQTVNEIAVQAHELANRCPRPSFDVYEDCVWRVARESLPGIADEYIELYADRALWQVLPR